MSQCILELRNIAKEYFWNRVLKGVSLQLHEGEIHALIGENGAGKSTLMNILFGMPVIHNTGGYEGEIYFQGQHVEIKTPHDAMETGIGMVHQEFMLLPGFTVTENIKLNREITRANVVSQVFGPPMRSLDMPSMEHDARTALDRLGLSLDETLKIAGLPVGYMQFVEIARELDKEKTKILVLDEPTAVLTESEADTLLSTMERLAKSGIAIFFITHRLGEVMRVADNITVLRDGELITTVPKSEASVERLAELMVGRELEQVAHHRELEEANEDTFIELRDLHVDMPGESVHGIDLKIRRGEILGLGGLAGQGKIGIANGIMGHYPATGTVHKEGKDIPLNDTPAALNAGMAFVSEDRRGVGLLLDQSIELNIAVPSMQSQHHFLTEGALNLSDKKAIRAHAMDMIERLDIRCTGPDQLTRRLSGGNQQKVCIAKALTLHPNLLFVSEPTRGIDIGAKKIVLDLLVKLNQEWGVTVVVTSSELAELRAICDRIAIVYEGKIEGILKPDASDREFGVLLAGGSKVLEKEAS